MTNVYPGKPGERPIFEMVAGRIVELIKAEGLRSGDRLPAERELSEQLEVSRTVVRDALKVLTGARIVQTRHGSGVYVTYPSQTFTEFHIDLTMSVDPEHIASLYQFRLTLETDTARLSAARISYREVEALETAIELHRQGALERDAMRFREGDVAFHHGLALASGNSFLSSAVDKSLKLQNWAVDLALEGTPGSLMDAVEQHQAILSAVKRGEAENAAQAMRTHLVQALSNYQLEVRRRLRPDL